MTRVRWGLVVGATLLSAFVVAGCGGSGHATSTGTTGGSFADLVARVRSGVVRVEVDLCGAKGVGTGFLVGPRLVVTVEHVVDGATRIVFKRSGRTVATGVVVGADKARDLALVRTSRAISGYVLHFSPSAPRLGDEVGALGFPLGLPLTVTKGSVSGLDRTVPIEGTQRRRLVQTDAALNQGNSGGPLIALDTGEVVGLVDAGTTQANGIAFAVSSQVARPLVDAWKASPQPISLTSCSGSTGGQTATPGSAGGTSASGADHTYADDLDDALLASARTRRGLGELIALVNNKSVSYQNANSAIQAIVDQRRQLLAAVNQVQPPPAFQPSAELLRHALNLSIADDLAIESWIDATYQGDKSGASRYFQENIRLSASATQAKQAFLAEYNAQRRRLLGRAPLDVQF